MAEVVAAGGAAPCATAHAAAEEGLEDLAEAAEPLKAAEAAGVDARVAEEVVGAPFVGIGEDRVGLGALLEAIGGLWIVRVAVRVELHRQLPEGGLQLLRRGTPLNPENFVVVALDRHTYGLRLTRTRAGRMTRSWRR